MMPGSLLTYTIRKSLGSGARAGFLVVLGHALLELALVTLIFLGFDRFLQSDAAQIVIGAAGGILLAVMGVKMAYEAWRDKVKVDAAPDKARRGGMILSGIVISAANPYFLLWWAVIGLGFIMQAYTSFGYAGVAVYYAGHILADTVWYGLVSVVVGKTRRFIKQKPYRAVIAALGCLLVFFGARFFIRAVTHWLQVA